MMPVIPASAPTGDDSCKLKCEGELSMTEKPFLTDVQELRRGARQHIEEGAVTDAYRADRETVIKLLNEALATESVCVLRYKRHYFMAQALHADPISHGLQH